MEKFSLFALLPSAYALKYWPDPQLEENGLVSLRSMGQTLYIWA